MIIATLAAAAALNAAPAVAPADPAAATPAPAAASAKPADPLVCHEEVIAGSRVPTRVCRRRSTIEAQAREGRAMVEKLQSGVVAHGKGD